MTPSEFIEIVGVTPTWFELGVVDNDSNLNYQRECQAASLVEQTSVLSFSA